MTKKPTAIGGLNTSPLPPISSKHNHLAPPKSFSSPLSLSPEVTRKPLLKRDRAKLPKSSSSPEVIMFQGDRVKLPTLHNRYEPLPKINELAIDIALIKDENRFDELLEQIQIKNISLQMLADICERYLKAHGTLDEEIVLAWLEDNKYSEDILKPSNNLWEKFGTSANYVREAFVRKYVEDSESLVGADSLARILNANQDLPAKKIIKIWFKGFIGWLSDEESKEKIEALLKDENLLEEFRDMKDYVKTQCESELKKLYKAESEKYKSEYEELAALSDVELIHYKAAAKDFMEKMADGMVSKKSARVKNKIRSRDVDSILEPVEEMEEEELEAKTAISPSSSRAIGPAATHSADKSPPR